MHGVLWLAVAAAFCSVSLLGLIPLLDGVLSRRLRRIVLLVGCGAAAAYGLCVLALLAALLARAVPAAA